MPATGLEVLPETTLPRYDGKLAASLERAIDAEEYVQAMDRIGRFASPRIFGRVRSVYERFPSSRGCEVAPAALAYFFRAAPGYARAELTRVMDAVARDGNCEAGVLPEIARRRMLPAVEDAALRLLENAEGWVIADVTAMIKQYGTPRAETALWRAFERWHERWKDRTAKLEADQGKEDGLPWDEAVERDLSEALATGTAWLMTPSSLARLRSLCLTSRCKDNVESWVRLGDTTPGIRMRPPAMPRAEPRFVLADTTFGMVRSREGLDHWLMLHPAGTEFEWQDESRFEEDAYFDDLWLPGEAARCLEEVRTFAARHGMTVVRRR
jgi:hypothetical protein